MPTENPTSSSPNEDETSIMSSEELPWVDAAFIQDALRRGDRRDTYARVKSLTIERATAPGDNFASVIYRVRATLAAGAEERCVLVKALPKGHAMEKEVLESGVFRYEIDMLAKHVPAMKVLLDRASAPGQLFPPFAPRCMLHGTAPVPFLVLEDLKPQGFRMADRQCGLGLRHSVLALRSLARFHASSVALLAENPSIAKDFTNPMRGDGAAWENSWIVSGVQKAITIFKEMPGYEEYGYILERFERQAMEAVAGASDTIQDGFNVILHGDFWTNNMMFKYNEDGKPVDIRLVDLQLSHVSSPANDLLYFIYTSLSDDVFENYETLLLHEYHRTLIQTLDLFSIKGPSFKEILCDLDKHSAYALFGALSVWPVARAKGTPAVDPSQAGDCTANDFMFECPSTKQWLQLVLPEFKRRGWLKY